MDNVRTDCGFDRSNFRLAGHVDWSKFNRIKSEINSRFLLFSCYLSSRCVLRNFVLWGCHGVINFISSHLNPVYQVCIAYRNVSTLFKLFLF